MKFGRLIWANLLRKKVRLLLTLGSFAVALFLFAFLAVVRDAFNRGADVRRANEIVTLLEQAPTFVASKMASTKKVPCGRFSNNGAGLSAALILS